jgi:hypothetical protein
MADDGKYEWFIPKTIQHAQYINFVNQALIPHEVKDLCRYNQTPPTAQPCDWG